MVAALPPWNTLARPILPLLEEAESSQWDCLVVGCGGAACFAALQLARGGARVALLADPGQEEQLLRLPGVSLPFLADHYWSLVQGIGRPQARLWWQMASQGSARLRELLQSPEVAPDPDFAKIGSAMLLAVNPAEANEMTQGLRWLKEDGIEARMMGGAASSNYAPVGEPEAALLFPGAAVFDPAWLQSHLWKVLQRAGVHCFTTASRWKVRQGPLALVSHQSREALTESVILANGLHSLALLGVQRPWLFPLRGQSFLSTPILQGLRSSVVALTANRGHEVYRDWGSSMIAAGMHPGAGTAEISSELEVDLAFAQQLQKVAGGRLSELEQSSSLARWAAVYDYTMDGLPLIGNAAGQSQVWLAAGFGGSEWSAGVGAGLEIAKALQGQNTFLRELPSASPRRFA